MNKNELIVYRKSLPIKKEDRENISCIPVNYEMVDASHYRFDFNLSDSVSINMFESDRIIDIDDFIDIECEDDIEDTIKPYLELAAACGSLTGFIGTFINANKLEEIGKWKDKDWNNIVVNIAKYIGYEKKDYKGAIKFIKSKISPIKSKFDDEISEKILSGFTDKLAAHPTFAGLCFSILSQFCGKMLYFDENNEIKKAPLPEYYSIGEDVNTKIIFGTIYWLYNICIDSIVSKNDIINNISLNKELLRVIKTVIRRFSKNENIDKIPTSLEDIEKALSNWLNNNFNDVNARDNGNKYIDKIVQFMNRIVKDSIWAIVNEAITVVAYAALKVKSLIDSNKIESILDISKLDTEVLFPAENRILSRMMVVSYASFVGTNIGACVVKAIKGKNVGDREFAECILAEINIAGIGRLIFAIANDSKYWIEDFKVIFNKILNKKKTVQDETVDVDNILQEDVYKSVSLDEEHSRILLSLENFAMLYDIKKTSKDEDVKLKKEWRVKWEEKVKKSFENVDHFGLIKDEKYLYENVYKLSQDDSNKYQMYLMTIELISFKPYEPIGDDNDKKYSKLSYTDRYINDRFIRKQTVVSQEEVDKLRKKISYYNGIVSGKTQKFIAGAGAAVAVAAIAAGAAFAFAPAIATFMVGGAFEGLKGVALTNASLAFIGGGSIAAGGMGMAGGTAIITGGGAMLGLASSSAVSSIAMISLTQKNIWVDCGKKLLSYSSVVLIDIMNDSEKVKAIHKNISEYTKKQEEALKSIIDEDNDLDDLYIKDYKDAIKCLNRVCNEFEKLLKNKESDKTEE